MFTLFRRISKVAILQVEPAIYTSLAVALALILKARSSMGSVWRERLHEWSCRNMSNDQEIVTSKPLKPWVSFWIDCLIFFAFTDLLVFPWNRKGRTELGDVTPHNIKQLKKLNSVVFPVSYNDKVKIKLSIVCWEKIR